MKMLTGRAEISEAIKAPKAAYMARNNPEATQTLIQALIALWAHLKGLKPDKVQLQATAMSIMANYGYLSFEEIAIALKAKHAESLYGNGFFTVISAALKQFTQSEAYIQEREQTHVKPQINDITANYLSELHKRIASSGPSD